MELWILSPIDTILKKKFSALSLGVSAMITSPLELFTVLPWGTFPETSYRYLESNLDAAVWENGYAETA